MPARSEAHEKAAMALGSAVHPAALDRLFELCPEAVVRVRHQSLGVLGATWYERANGAVVPYAFRTTVVQIDLARGDVVYGRARCHPEDNYDRRKGIELAFRRALKRVPR